MKVHQQFLVGRRAPDGRVDVTTVAASADPGTVRENEDHCRAWIPAAPNTFGRALVHAPVGDAAKGGAGDHVVALLRGTDDEVRIHLLRLDAEAFAVSGDDPFRPWRRGVLREDWDDDSTFPPLEPMAIGNGLTAGLRAMLPPQYPVLEALLRRALADDGLVLEVGEDGPAAEDLLEQVVHLVPRSRRRSMHFHSAATTDACDLGARIVPGANLRAGLQGIVDAPAPTLDDALEDYVTTLFALLRDHDYDGARVFIDDFGADEAEVEESPLPAEPTPTNDPSPRTPRLRLVFGVLLLLIVAGTGYWFVHRVSDDAPSPEVATTDDRLSVGPRPSLDAFVRAQTRRVQAHMASGVPVARLRRTLSAHRVAFENEARASWAADRAAADARLQSALTAEPMDPSMVAGVLSEIAESARENAELLHALHVAFAAGRPELVGERVAETAGPNAMPGRSSLAEEVRAWAAGLDAWAGRFEVASADAPLSPPDLSTPTIDEIADSFEDISR